MTDWIARANLAAALYMTGLIWFVQIVHYPLMAEVSTAGYRRYQALHQRYTTLVVLPPMVIELSAAALLVLRRPAGWSATIAWTGLALLGLAWLSTFLLQVPRHNVLAAGFDAVAHRELVATNWIRTAAWSARSALLLWSLP